MNSLEDRLRDAYEAADHHAAGYRDPVPGGGGLVRPDHRGRRD
jgi:hypothetical protein